MSSDGSRSSNSSRLSQFGLYRTIDARTEEFLRLSRKRQIRQGCACAAVSTAITVTVVVTLLLVYEYTINGNLNHKNKLQKASWDDVFNISSKFDAKFNKTKLNLDPTTLKLLPMILKALNHNVYLEKLIEESSVGPTYTEIKSSEEYTSQKISFNNWLRPPNAIDYKTLNKNTANLDNYHKTRNIRNYQKVLNLFDKVLNYKEYEYYDSTASYRDIEDQTTKKEKPTKESTRAIFTTTTDQTTTTKTLRHKIFKKLTTTTKTLPTTRSKTDSTTMSSEIIKHESHDKKCFCKRKLDTLLMKLITSLQEILPQLKSMVKCIDKGFSATTAHEHATETSTTTLPTQLTKNIEYEIEPKKSLFVEKHIRRLNYIPDKFGKKHNLNKMYDGTTTYLKMYIEPTQVLEMETTTLPISKKVRTKFNKNPIHHISFKGTDKSIIKNNITSELVSAIEDLNNNYKFYVNKLIQDHLLLNINKNKLKIHLERSKHPKNPVQNDSNKSIQTTKKTDAVESILKSIAPNLKDKSWLDKNTIDKELILIKYTPNIDPILTTSPVDKFDSQKYYKQEMLLKKINQENPTLAQIISPSYSVLKKENQSEIDWIRPNATDVTTEQIVKLTSERNRLVSIIENAISYTNQTKIDWIGPNATEVTTEQVLKFTSEKYRLVSIIENAKSYTSRTMTPKVTAKMGKITQTPKTRVITVQSEMATESTIVHENVVADEDNKYELRKQGQLKQFNLKELARILYTKEKSQNHTKSRKQKGELGIMNYTSDWYPGGRFMNDIAPDLNRRLTTPLSNTNNANFVIWPNKVSNYIEDGKTEQQDDLEDLFSFYQSNSSASKDENQTVSIPEKETTTENEYSAWLDNIYENDNAKNDQKLVYILTTTTTQKTQNGIEQNGFDDEIVDKENLIINQYNSLPQTHNNYSNNIPQKEANLILEPKVEFRAQPRYINEKSMLPINRPTYLEIERYDWKKFKKDYEFDHDIYPDAL